MTVPDRVRRVARDPRIAAGAQRQGSRRSSAAACCSGARARSFPQLPATNELESPTRYRIAPADHFAAIRTARGRGLDVVGAYHSHPRSAAVPSATDLADAQSDLLYVIIGADATVRLELRGWRLVDGNFLEIAARSYPMGRPPPGVISYVSGGRRRTPMKPPLHCSTIAPSRPRTIRQLSPRRSPAVSRRRVNWSGATSARCTTCSCQAYCATDRLPRICTATVSEVLSHAAPVRPAISSGCLDPQDRSQHQGPPSAPPARAGAPRRPV